MAPMYPSPKFGRNWKFDFKIRLMSLWLLTQSSSAVLPWSRNSTAPNSSPVLISLALLPFRSTYTSESLKSSPHDIFLSGLNKLSFGIWCNLHIVTSYFYSSLYELWTLNVLSTYAYVFYIKGQRQRQSTKGWGVSHQLLLASELAYC